MQQAKSYSDSIMPCKEEVKSAMEENRSGSKAKVNRNHFLEGSQTPISYRRNRCFARGLKKEKKMNFLEKNKNWKLIARK